MSSPLYATSRRPANNNILPTITLDTSRPIPSIVEEHSGPTASVCQQATVEISTDDTALRCGDVVVRAAVRSRPVTARRTRTSVHGRTVSMPSWRPLNVDREHHVIRVIPPIPRSTAATVNSCDQLPGIDVPAEEYEHVQEIRISSPRTNIDNGGGAQSSAAISISLSGRTKVADSRRMSHVTLDFDPPPPPPRRFDPPPSVMTSQQVRQINRDDRRTVRPSKTRDTSDAAACKAELDAARRRYFSVAEWNRQKVLHLRRASLRRSCLTGIPLSWTHLAGQPDRRQAKGCSATANGRRRQRVKTGSARSERTRPPSIAAEIPSSKFNYATVQPLTPISESRTIIAAGGRVTGRRAATEPGSQQNNRLMDDCSTETRATSDVGRCPPHHTRPSHRTPQSTARKEPETNEQTVAAHAQQKPEAYDSGLDSDAPTRTTTEHQSLPAANVDLQKVKDVLEHPASRGRTRNDDIDDDDREKCDGNDDVTDCNNSVEQTPTDTYELERPRQSLDLPRYDNDSNNDDLL